MMGTMAVGLVCVAALTAWVLWLQHSKWLTLQRDKQRDETLATLEPRVRELENAAKQSQLQRMVR